MRGTYWSALIGLAIFTGAIIFALLMLALGTPNDGRDQQEQRARAAAEKCAAEIRILVPAASSPAQQAVGEAATQPNHNDLCQQIRMAVASEDTAWYAKWQWIAGLVSLAGVGVATIYAGLAYSVAKKALFDLERPHVFVDVSESGLEDVTNDGSYRFAGQRVEFRCLNYGRTPAMLTEIRCRFFALEDGKFPRAVDPTKKKGRELPVGCVATIEVPYRESDTALKTYGADFYKLTKANAFTDFKVFFIGFVRYADVHDRKYINGFCLVYDPIGERYVRRGDNQRYNYSRKE